MKSLLFGFTLLFCTSLFGQNILDITMNDKNWKPKSVSAGIQSVMDMTTFGIIGMEGKERFDISIDYNALKGKDTATFVFSENMMAPPGGASLSYVPQGIGRQQWISLKGELFISEFDETAHSISGRFEGVLTMILDDKGGFVLKTPKPTMNVSGKFEKVAFKRLN